MKYFHLVAILLFGFLQTSVFSQINIDGNNLFGNEWIDYEKSYVKIIVEEDGVYRVNYKDLENAGFPIADITGAQLKMFSFGKELPIRVSRTGALSTNDFIEFIGKKNRGELDKHMYVGSENHLNPEYSLYTDKAAYFLTWSDEGSENVRLEEVKTDLNGNVPPVELFYKKEELKVYSRDVLKPLVAGIRYSSFRSPEGFSSGLQNEFNIEFSTKNIYDKGSRPQIDIRLSGNANNHFLIVKLNNELIKSTKFERNNIYNLSETINLKELKESNTLNIKGNHSGSDLITLAYAKITYPSQFIFDNLPNCFLKLEKSVFTRYIELQGINADNAEVYAFDGINAQYFPAIVENGLVKIILPPSQKDRELYIFNNKSGEKSPIEINNVTFVDYTQIDPEYIILSSEKFKNQSTNYLQDYSDYRSSEAGGGFNTTIVYVEDLYNQFAYGLSNHPLSIKNFANYFTGIWTNQKFIFLIGKGFEYPYYRTIEDYAEPSNQNYSIPTFGFPGSDNLLLSKEWSTVPVIPSGRLPIVRIEELKMYLDKVKQHETLNDIGQSIENQLWRKKILHLSGGDNERLQNDIFSFLNKMKSEIENDLYGGNVITFRKTNSEPIQSTESKELVTLINNGLSIITFFGHSSAGTFDFSLEQPSKYENTGKYPLILSLGCFSGNIHSSAIGISEDFVIEKDKGAIAFIAASGTGQPSPQAISGLALYKNIGEESFGQSIGVSMRKSLAARDSINSRSVKSLNEQLTLNGDPAVKLFYNDGPDFTFDFEAVKTIPSIVSTNLDSFTLIFNLVNLGKAIDEDVNVTIKRVNPKGVIILEKTIKIKSPRFAENISLNLPTGSAINLGKNKILLSVDEQEEISELPLPQAEQNNKLSSSLGEEGFSFYYLDIGTTPIYPEEFSIIGNQDITLKASTNNLFGSEIKYLIQIDTTEEFNSPSVKHTEVIQKSGLIQWTPELNYNNEQVYYWRISPDSTNVDIGYLWNTSSFVYIQDAEKGWNQSHYYQFNHDTFDGLRLPESRQLEFDTSGFWISVHNQIYKGNEKTTGYQFNFENFSDVIPWKFMDGGMAIVVGDGVTGAGYGNNGGAFGSIDGGINSKIVFGYDTKDPTSRQGLVSFIDNEVNEGDFVMLFSVLANENSEIGIEDWEKDAGKTIFDLLKEQGATKLDEFKANGTVPYTFVFQKNKKVFHEDLANTKNDFIRTDFFLPRLGTGGSMLTELIGPAKKWKKLVWEESNKQSSDESYFVIIGVDNEGKETSLFNFVTEANFDLSTIDASQYPYLKMEYHTEDKNQRTTPNLDLWRVYFSGLPDAAVNPSAHFRFQGKDLSKGKDLEFEVAVDNVNQIDMDSVLIKYTITGQNNLSVTEYQRYAPLKKGESIIAKYKKSTEEFKGVYQFTMEVNPDKDQAEQHHFNNFGIVEFKIGQDNENPILDVTFDGIHIMDYDIVAAEPVITLSLRDNNEFLLLNNISLFDISLENLATGNIEELASDDPRLSFTPAKEGEENKAYLAFNPNLEEGEYKLVVQAQDVSGNYSGKNRYEINFRVITKQSIGNLMNYPNPFSTSTQFVFTLTGHAPQSMKIEIMTLSGKVVKEITSDELGALRVGNNVTDYRWDGTDDFGQQLANGIYLYRLIATDENGVNIEKFKNDSLSKFFKEDFGKLVILR